MTRDYKNRRSRKKDATPGWVWGLGGLAVGLAVALAVHLQDRRQMRPAAPVANTSAIPSSASEAAMAEEEEPASRFDFYEMLKNFEVVIPETESTVSKTGNNPAPVAKAGIYVLQAGSFQAFEDADRMKARLALQGLQSQIQRVTIDDKRWHRVRLGPFTDLDELQTTRRQLREADVEVLVLRVGE
ncbi:MAG: SPOR domain-containing protein [Gammaproteobacteria bacterium]|nr:SPOR domain-containing protein [Gammaproteobacteria bacterium]NNF60344.1 SPOR domain-containing protein [Gammaproteobacteria bacterium]NNM20612.1 SPOR domain-containing protein [Gammaproteobacteria bacterium]